MSGEIGDMTLVGHDAMSAPLLKALGVIANHLHPTFNEQEWIRPDWSKQSCVLCSLTVRDFLRSIGIAADVRPVAAIFRAEAKGEVLHSLGMGHPDSPLVEDGRWNGHLIVVVPGEGIMIDTTLYHADRRQWRKAMPKMAAIPYGFPEKLKRVFGLRPFAGLALLDPKDETFEMDILWLDWPQNDVWSSGPDSEEWRRAAVLMKLRHEFGEQH